MTDDSTVTGFCQAIVAGGEDIASGKLLIKRDLTQVVSSDDDIYNFASEAYGMIWYLATHMANYNKELAASWVEDAFVNYKRGISLSPGANGELNPYFVEKPADAKY